MKTIIVKLENKNLEVKKLPLGKYAELLRAMQKIPTSIAQLPNASNDEMLKMLPTLLADCLPEVVQVVVIATDLTVGEVEAFGLDEMIDVVTAIMTVNNYQAVYEKIKKALAQPMKAANQTKIGSGGQSTS